MRAPDWQTPDGRIQLYRGDCLDILPTLPRAAAQVLVTDPPYSSGGFTRGDRMADPAEKYVSTGTDIVRATFGGDNRDGRSWCYWMQLWLTRAAEVLAPSAYALLFTDWRQLPLCTDAFQAAGFVWRGIVSWDKTLGSRAPHTGYFRHQCEFVVWGSLGPTAKAPGRGPFPGSYTIPVRQADKHHMTGKPTELMRQLVRCAEPDAVVLDPFMGSGTTGVACALEGRRFIGCEQDAHYFHKSIERIEATLARQALPLLEAVEPEPVPCAS